MNSVREFSLRWYCEKYQETGQLIMSNWTRELLKEHGSAKKVIAWMKVQISLIK